MSAYLPREAVAIVGRPTGSALAAPPRNGAEASRFGALFDSRSEGSESQPFGDRSQRDTAAKDEGARKAVRADEAVPHEGDLPPEYRSDDTSEGLAFLVPPEWYGSTVPDVPAERESVGSPDIHELISEGGLWGSARGVDLSEDPAGVAANTLVNVSAVGFAAALALPGGDAVAQAGDARTGSQFLGEASGYLARMGAAPGDKLSSVAKNLGLAANRFEDGGAWQVAGARTDSAGMGRPVTIPAEILSASLAGNGVDPVNAMYRWPSASSVRLQPQQIIPKATPVTPGVALLAAGTEIGAASAVPPREPGARLGLVIPAGLESDPAMTETVFPRSPRPAASLSGVPAAAGAVSGPVGITPPNGATTGNSRHAGAGALDDEAEASPRLSEKRLGDSRPPHLAGSPQNAPVPVAEKLPVSSGLIARGAAPTPGGDGFTAPPELEVSISGTASADQRPSIHAPGVANAISAQVVAAQVAHRAVESNGQTTQLILEPEELGKVTLKMATDERTITVFLVADRPETLDLLRRNIGTLEQEFRSLGYENVNFGFEGDRSPGPRQDSTNAERSEAPVAELGPVDAAPRPRPHSAGQLDIRL